MEAGIIPSPDSPFHSQGRSAILNGKQFMVKDYWRWAYSSINENTNRGMVGQYIVACAIGLDHIIQVGWQAYDLLAPNERRIEVKTTAKAQIWENSKSQPQFRIVPTRVYSYENGYAKEKTFNAEIYVLCYYFWEDRKTMDATNLDHWKFWVLTLNHLRKVLEGKPVIAVTKLESNCQSVDAFKLKDTILSL